jgi:multidrug efflux pump subunit AcrA (membrane-fusion protein)
MIPRAPLVALVIAIPFAFGACGGDSVEVPLKDFSLSEAVKDARKQQEAAAQELREIRARERSARQGERAELESAIAQARRERRRALAEAERLAREREAARAP